MRAISAEREAAGVTDTELLGNIEALRNLMVAVATGGPRIASVNGEYMERRAEISDELSRRGVSDPNPYDDLWAWYGKWSGGDLPTYQSRRQHISEIYRPLVEHIKTGSSGVRVLEGPTRWVKVDRQLDAMRQQLARSQAEEQFQQVGLLGREVLISLAQVVYDVTRHPTLDSVDPSDTDAKRMLEAYLSVELVGSSNEAARRHARAALELANNLQHRRTATFRDAALCAEATTSVVNLIAIISGQRDPEQSAT